MKVEKIVALTDGYVEVFPVSVKDAYKLDEFVTINPNLYPKDTQVWRIDYYDRSERKYHLTCWGDANREKFLKGDKIVYVGFEF